MVFFWILLLLFRTSCSAGVTNSAIFNIFHNRGDFGTILWGFRSFGWGGLNTRLGAPLDVSLPCEMAFVNLFDAKTDAIVTTQEYVYLALLELAVVVAGNCIRAFLCFLNSLLQKSYTWCIALYRDVSWSHEVSECLVQTLPDVTEVILLLVRLMW